jgi:2-keto-4-pentenoate hydratase
MPQELTELLLDHRASGVLIDYLAPDLVPQTAEEAYRIQHETVAALGRVGAWKVQPMPETGLPFAAPILAKTIFADGADLRAIDFPSLGIEVEVAVTLNRDLPLRSQDYTAEDIQGAIASLHLAFEVLASRFVDRQKVPLLAGIADLQHSGAIVLGPAFPVRPLPEFGSLDIELTIDKGSAGKTEGNATTGNMLTALAWLANHTAARNLALRAGDIVITGARVGPVPGTGSYFEARTQILGSVSVKFR